MNTTELMYETARQRLSDLDSGRVAAIPADEVFEKVCRRPESTRYRPCVKKPSPIR
jgi:hypothetical protein